MTFGGAVSIDLGSLDDNLAIDDCHFFGAVSVNCGAGGDLVQIEQQVTPSFSEFKGAVPRTAGRVTTASRFSRRFRELRQ